MLNKPTLQWYSEAKLYIGYGECYRNNRNSEYLAKERTNSFQLEEHFGRGKRNYDKTCKLCKVQKRYRSHKTMAKPKYQETNSIHFIQGQELWKDGQYDKKDVAS